MVILMLVRFLMSMVCRSIVWCMLIVFSVAILFVCLCEFMNVVISMVFSVMSIVIILYVRLGVCC